VLESGLNISPVNVLLEFAEPDVFAHPAAKFKPLGILIGDLDHGKTAGEGVLGCLHDILQRHILDERVGRIFERLGDVLREFEVDEGIKRFGALLRARGE
jgi:hypothetical protein